MKPFSLAIIECMYIQRTWCVYWPYVIDCGRNLCVCFGFHPTPSQFIPDPIVTWYSWHIYSWPTRHDNIGSILTPSILEINMYIHIYVCPFEYSKEVRNLNRFSFTDMPVIFFRILRQKGWNLMRFFFAIYFLPF